MTPDGLAGKVAVVTGASRGIGRAICVAFANAGADIVVAARSTQAEPSRLAGTIESVAAEVEALGRRALAVRTDVRDDASVTALMRRAGDAFGRIDVLVNNAAYLYRAPFAGTPPAKWDLVFDVNLGGSVRCIRAALPGMLERGGGRIINVTSGAVTMALPDIVSYAASKAALEALTQGLASELAGTGVAVNALRIDSAVATEGALALNPGGEHAGWATPASVADRALWIATRGAAFTGNIVSSKESAG